MQVLYSWLWLIKIVKRNINLLRPKGAKFWCCIGIDSWSIFEHRVIKDIYKSKCFSFFFKTKNYWFGIDFNKLTANPSFPSKAKTHRYLRNMFPQYKYREPSIFAVLLFEFLITHWQEKAYYLCIVFVTDFERKIIDFVMFELECYRNEGWLYIESSCFRLYLTSNEKMFLFLHEILCFFHIKYDDATWALKILKLWKIKIFWFSCSNEITTSSKHLKSQTNIYISEKIIFCQVHELTNVWPFDCKDLYSGRLLKFILLVKILFSL